MRDSTRFLLSIFLCALAACAPVRPTPPALAPAAPVSASPAAPAAMATPVTAAVAVAPPALDPAKRASFVAEASQLSGMSADEVNHWLDEARYQQSIVNAISKPAEGKPWKDYRPIFLTADRINSGRSFYAEHKSELQRIGAQSGVAPEYIVAIIGVETSYGRITGSYRVLDALYTLAFFYPRREEFFRGELAQLFALAKEQDLDLATLKGSYAGAMGWGQFMPSSYRKYGKDGDGDGKTRLLTSPRDAFASIANYFVGFGWKSGVPAFVPALAQPGAQPFVPETFEAKYSLADLAAKGYKPADAGAPDLPATLLTLEGANGPEYWIGYQNFYVITRYNRSPMYAMAVHQLAQAIAAPSPAQ
jgi:membrane-bound lytic murein transglycosylase B